jgi:hypothetical protein
MEEGGNVMVKRITFLALTVLLLVANVGYTANMQVNSSAVPVSGGTITPNGIKFSSTFINYSVAAKTGWTLSSVIIDNSPIAATPTTTPNHFQVPFNTSKIHTIKANFAQTLYTISTSAVGGGGTVSVTGGGPTNIIPGSSRNVVVAPSTYNKILTLIVDGTAVYPTDPTVAYTVNYANIRDNKSVSATFGVIPTATAYAGTNMTVSSNSTLLTGSVSANSAPSSYVWQITSGPAGASFTNGIATPTPNQSFNWTVPTTFNVTTLGTYTVTLTATVGGVNFVSLPATITVTTASVIEAGICSTCHAGGIQTTQWESSKHATTPTTGTITPPSCPSCHNPGLQLPHPGYYAGDTAANPGLYYSCVTCHYPGSTKVPSWPPPGLSFHNSYNGTNQCAQCHNPHSTAFNGSNMPYPHFSTFSTAQYVTKNISCGNCHVSSVDSTFNIYSANRQWARSGKGNVKSPAYIGEGPYTEANLAASDFKFLGTPLPAKPATTTAQDCVRCHTTTGFINYVTPTNLADPNTALSNIEAWGTPGDRTREMVACNACHNSSGSGFDATFSRRNIGIDPGTFAGYNYVVAWYGYSSASTKRIIRTKSFNNTNGLSMNDSNLCIACHTGKSAGDLIKYPTTYNPAAPSIAGRVGDTGTFWANVDFIDPHNMNAANLMFPNGVRAGYDYRIGTSSSPTHNNIGLDGTQGPCVSCHMTSPKKHTFSVLSTASNGTIGAITTNICVTCHGSSALPTSAAILQAKKDGYQASLEVIVAQLAAKGVYYNVAKAPYFFTTADPALQTLATRTVNWNSNGGANFMGAAFNLRLLQSGSGWVHNATYSKRLLYDTIDYLDDGTLNFSTTVTIQGNAIATGYIVPRP